MSRLAVIALVIAVGTLVWTVIWSIAERRRSDRIHRGMTRPQARVTAGTAVISRLSGNTSPPQFNVTVVNTGLVSFTLSKVDVHVAGASEMLFVVSMAPPAQGLPCALAAGEKWEGFTELEPMREALRQMAEPQGGNWPLTVEAVDTADNEWQFELRVSA